MASYKLILMIHLSVLCFSVVKLRATAIFQLLHNHLKKREVNLKLLQSGQLHVKTNSPE